MLHQINLPGYASILYDFLRFQQQLLEFACTPTLSDPLESGKVKQAFQGELGNWLCGKLWNVRSGQASDLRQYMQKLTDYVKLHPTMRDAVQPH